MPLSKLFHKRNSVKDKGALSKPTDHQENKTNSTACDSVNMDIQTEASISSEHPTGPEIEVLFDKENEEVSAPAEQISPPNIQTIGDISYESKSGGNRQSDSTLPDQSSSKAENVQDASSDCKNEEIRIEGSISTEKMSSKTEILIQESMEVRDKLPLKAENIQNISFENVDCMLIEELSSKTETMDNAPCDLNEKVVDVGCVSSEQVSPEDIRDTSLDIKTVGILSEGSTSAEKLPLKDGNMEDVLSNSSNEETQSDSRQLTEQSQKKEELCPIFKESDDVNGESIPHGLGNSFTESSFPKENADHQTKKGKEKTTKHSNRSSSFRECGSKPNPPKSRRRKCESESAASNSTDDEGFDDKVLRFGITDLEKMIGQCVNRLIRESITTAVRNVNVDSLCDEVLKSISDRSQSESSSETIEQRLHTNSVKEYADLEMMDTFEDGESDCEAQETLADAEFEEEIGQKTNLNQGENSECDGYFLEDAPNASAVEELRDASGYHADCEESLSVHSMTIENGSKGKPGEISPGNAISVGDTSSVGNSNVGHGSLLLKTNESVDSSPKQDAEEVTKTCDRNMEIMDSSLEKDDTKIAKSDVTSDVVDSSLKKDSEEESRSDITNEIVASLVENVPEENLVSRITHNSMNSSLKNVAEEVKITNEIVERSQNQDSEEHKVGGMLRVESEDLISMCEDAVHEPESDQTQNEVEPDLVVPQQSQATDDEKKVNWKAGYLHVKLPHKSRGKGHLKAWKKRCVSIQPDEFAHSDPCLIVSVFSGSERKRGASFWKSVSCQRAVIYRSSSSTQRYAFTVAEDDCPVVHLAADSEADAQGWMAAMRAVLWPPSPVVELEKMLNGSQFEVSLIDNEFSYRAGLLGMYGHLTITQKKLILVHPQQGYVIQEWYLNTVDKFELSHQTRIEDVHKVLCMTTCSDSSTGKGEILIFCREAVSLLQSLASTIHKILTYHSKQEGGRYQKELEEIAEWLVPSNPVEAEDYYKVPPRQVRSLLDIPNFIFDKPLTPVATVACSSGHSMDSTPNKPLSEASKTNPSRASQDSGISAEAQLSDDFLNCSLTSFVVGGGAFHPGKSSDSELSDSYTPPLSPTVKVKHVEENVKNKTDELKGVPLG